MKRAGLSLLAAVMAALIASGTPHAATMTSEAARAALQQAFDERKRGDLDAVIVKVEPIIAAFEDMQREKATFCAENQAQALAVLTTFIASDAAKAGKSAIVADEAFCVALFLKGFTLIDTGQPAKAGEFLRRAHEAEPLNAHFLNEYAEWYKMAGQWQRAHDLFKQAEDLADMANDADKSAYRARALRGMGYTEIELGKLDDAERHMRESQKYDLDNKATAVELEYIARLRRKGST